MKALKDVFFLGLCITFGCFIAGFIKELCFFFFFLPDLKKTKQRTIKKTKNWSIVPPCGHVWHYTGVFMTALMNDQDMSVLFHCVPANFAPMSTFLKATVMNKEMSLISTNHGFCFLWIVILSNSHIHMNLEACLALNLISVFILFFCSHNGSTFVCHDNNSKQFHNSEQQQ